MPALHPEDASRLPIASLPVSQIVPPPPSPRSANPSLPTTCVTSSSSSFRTNNIGKNAAATATASSLRMVVRAGSLREGSYRGGGSPVESHDSEYEQQRTATSPSPLHRRLGSPPRTAPARSSPSPRSLVDIDFDSDQDHHPFKKTKSIASSRVFKFDDNEVAPVVVVRVPSPRRPRNKRESNEGIYHDV